MKRFEIRLCFDNIDNSLYTDEKAAVLVQVEATDWATAHILAKHLQGIYTADSYLINDLPG